MGMKGDGDGREVSNVDEFIFGVVFAGSRVGLLLLFCFCFLSLFRLVLCDV